MSDYNSNSFLESELGGSDPSDSLFHVVPACYEKSVSYGKGTAKGPQAILEASRQLEVYDGISIPAQRGIFTHPLLPCDGQPEEDLAEIAGIVGRIIHDKKIPVLLGGEHTVTVGALYALKQHGKSVGIVQFDAHADLRDTYEGSKLSHACVMHRAVEMGFPIFQLGVRSLSPYEVEYRKENDIPFLDAANIARSGLPDPLLPDDFPETIYITFDVDGLDPSVIPATGTPEPGGLLWYQAMDALQNIMTHRDVIGFDVVELAPIEGLHTSDFASARLVYNIMGMIDRETRKE